MLGRSARAGGAGGLKTPRVVSDKGKEMGAAALGPAKCLSLSLQLSTNKPLRCIRTGTRSSCNNHLGAAPSPNAQPGKEDDEVWDELALWLSFSRKCCVLASRVETRRKGDPRVQVSVV